MSTINTNRFIDTFPGREGGVVVRAAPILLEGSFGTSTFGNNLVGTQVDRALLGIRDFGTGEFAFGSLTTPQAMIINSKLEYDKKFEPDPSWNKETAAYNWEGVQPDLKAAVQYMGGNALKDSIINESTSFGDMMGRLHQLNELARARIAVDNYDQSSNFLSYGVTKTVSALSNYIFSDPITAVSIVATAGLAGSAAGVAEAGSTATKVSRLASLASKIENIQNTYGKTYRAATYLWNTTDAASSSYSAWDSIYRTNKKLYGSTATLDENWVDDVAFGAALGLGFTFAADMIGGFGKQGLRGSTKPTSPLSNLENTAAQAGQNGQSIADAASMSIYHHRKNALIRALDDTEGPDSQIRRMLTDDETRSNLGWGSSAEMDDLTKWIKDNKPSTAELEEYVASKMRIRAQNHANVLEWKSQHDDWVEQGGDGAEFYRRQAHAQLKAIAGAEYSKYRFIIQHLEDTVGDTKAVAEWIARADMERLERHVGAINMVKALDAAEASALDAAQQRVLAQFKEVTRAEILAKPSSARSIRDAFMDNLREGRWQGAIEQLNEIHNKTIEAAGNTLARIDADLTETNRLFRSMNSQSRRRLREFDNAINAIERLKEATRKWTSSSDALRRRALSIDLNPDSEVSDVLSAANNLVSGPAYVSEEMAAAFKEAVEAIETVQKMRESILANAKAVGNEQAALRMLTGIDGISKHVTIRGEFPLAELALSNEGWHHVMKASQARVTASNRWRLQFVDNLIGEGASESALKTGSFPLRPVRHSPVVPTRLTIEQQDQILAEELTKIDPQLQAIRANADDADLATRADRNRLTAKFAEDRANKIQSMIDSGGLTGDAAKTASAKVAKLKNAAKKANNLATRLEKQASEQLGNIVPSPEPVVKHVTQESVEATRRNAAQANLDNLNKELKAMSESDLSSKKGYALRNKIRKAAVDVQGGTEYNKLNKERELLDNEIPAADKKVKKLEADGAGPGDPNLKAARNELEYLKKRSDKIRKDIDAINKRPVAMRKSASLAGNAPTVMDIMEVTAMRVKAALALAKNNETDMLKHVGSMFETFGDVRNIPRWVELENELMTRISKAYDDAAAAGGSVDLDKLDIVGTSETGMISSIRTEGRDIVFDIRKTAADGTETVETIRSRPNIAAVESVPNSKVTTSPSGSKTSGTAINSPSDNIRAVLQKEGGSRLLIANNAAAAMGRIPVLRNLSGAVFRLITAGTRFGEIHSIGRELDMIVTAFNLLDNPEATVNALGAKTGVFRSFQHCRNEGHRAVMTAISIIDRNRRMFNEASMERVEQAVSTGVMDGLNAGERELAELMHSTYDRARRAIELTTGKPLDPNWTPRVFNHNIAIANSQEVRATFRTVYAERIRNMDALPDDLADSLGVRRGSQYASMTVDQRRMYDAAIDEYADQMASQTIRAQTAGFVDMGSDGVRVASIGQRSSMARTLEDAVVNDPRIRRWYITDPMESFHHYTSTRLPEILFNAELTRNFGAPTTFDDVIAALRDSFGAAGRIDDTVAREAKAAIDHIAEKWNYATGRIQYNPHLNLEGTFRTGNGIIRGSAGSFWGMAGLMTEVPRAWAASRMFGGGFSGFLDALAAFRAAGNPEALEDVAHAVDQYVSIAHSANGPSIGTTAGQRFMAPWERFLGTVTGRETVTVGNMSLGRARSSIVAFAEAYGETGTRLGGMQYFSGVARVIADRQAKRFISRNIEAMRRMAAELETIGAVAERTNMASDAFKQAARRAGIPWETALRMNHRGLLTKEAVENLSSALAGEGQVFRLNAIRGRLNDNTYTALSDFLSDAHNFAVPVTTFATNTMAKSALEKIMYNLTSYARSFALNVGFRNVANAGIASIAATAALVSFGENAYQSIRSVALGKKSYEDIRREYEDDPAGTYFRNSIKSPWLGAHNTTVLSVLDTVTPLELNAQTRGNSMISPMLQAYRSASNMLFSDDPFGRRDHEFLKTYTPFINTWYSRLSLGELEN